MKKLFVLFLVIALVICSATVNAADGKVIYDGKAGSFIFAPGTDYSLTDLFPDFKGVMPGDELTQKITVRNDSDYKIKANIYIRSLGAHEDSADFLSKLKLKVAKSEENKMAYMFDAAADQSAQLTDWVLLGTLYSGGEVNLDVTLSVPVELDNEFQDRIGFLDWEFRVEEMQISPDDPKPPGTGDSTPMGLWLAVGGCVAAMIIFIIIKRRRDNDE